MSSDLDSAFPPSRFSDYHTKKKTSGHLNKKVASNGNYNKTSAEVSSNLQRRPFFFGLHLILVANSRNFGLISTKNFFFNFFGLIAAALQLHLDSTAKASPHATLYSLNAACIQHLTKSNSKFKFFNVMLTASLEIIFLFYFFFIFACCVHWEASFCRPFAACRPRLTARTAKWLLRHCLDSKYFASTWRTKHTRKASYLSEFKQQLFH